MDTNPHSTGKAGQKESGRRLFLLAGLGACFAGFPARAADLDAGGLTFRDPKLASEADRLFETLTRA